MPLHSRSTRLATVCVALLLLGGCASPGAATQSLADSKSATQLLRLDTSSRIPKDFISEIVRPTDVAEPCGAGDPNLQWVSSASARLTSDASGDVLTVYRDLVDSFVERGWNREVVSDSEATLTSTKSIATVTISAVENTVPVSVDIRAVGPCLFTSGLDSSDVQVLLST